LLVGPAKMRQCKGKSHSDYGNSEKEKEKKKSS